MFAMDAIDHVNEWTAATVLPSVHSTCGVLNGESGTIDFGRTLVQPHLFQSHPLAESSDRTGAELAGLRKADWSSPDLWVSAATSVCCFPPRDAVALTLAVG